MRYLLIIFIFFGVKSNTILAQVQPDHTVIVILENHSYNEIYNSSLAPYINSVANDPHTALLTQSFGLAHPSQPNYLMLFSGSAQGVVNDNVPAVLPFLTANVGSSLLQKGFGFTGYSETLPSIGYTGATSGAYARKHNPWVNWQGAGSNGIPSNLNMPFTAFPSDFSNLPTLSFVIPNQNNDMHNGTITTSIPPGDSWVQTNLDSYIQWCKTNNSLFILTFDEDDATQNNHILTFITGENVRGGNFDQAITHYNVLRTIEDLYQLPYAGASNDSAVIRDIWINKEFCNNGSDKLHSNLSGTNYQWQLNTGGGFYNIIDNANYTGTNTSSLQLNNIPSFFYGYEYRCVVDGQNSNSITIRFTDYWNGTVNTAWENPLNWSCGLPDSNTDVIINAGTVILNSDASVRSVKIKKGVIYTVSSGYKLTVNH